MNAPKAIKVIKGVNDSISNIPQPPPKKNRIKLGRGNQNHISSTFHYKSHYMMSDYQYLLNLLRNQEVFFL